MATPENDRYVERWECPEHGDRLREQQRIGPWCLACAGRVDPVKARYVALDAVLEWVRGAYDDDERQYPHKLADAIAERFADAR